MKKHYLESAFAALAFAVEREHMTKAAALDVLNDMHITGCDDTQTPLFLTMTHNGCIWESRYEFESVESAFDAMLEHIAEFSE